MLKNEIEKYELEVHRILSDETATLEETLEKLSNLTEKYNKLADRELRQYIAKQSLGLALELGSAILPIGGVAKAGGAISKQALKSVLGRKISERLGQGIASGLAGGGVFGFGSGIANDRNPIKESLKDAAKGGITGGAFAGAGANAEKVLKAHIIKNANIDNNMTKKEIDELRHIGKEYYKDYLQDTKIKDRYGNTINFPWQQVGKIKLHNYKLIPELKRQIKNADNYTKTNDKIREDALFFEKLYNYYRGKEYEYVIRHNSNNTGKDFYHIKELGSQPAYSSQNQVLGQKPNNSILPDKAEEFNMVKRLVREVINENSAKSAQILTKSADLNRIFTADEIAKMSKEEFMNFESMINKQINSGYGIPQRLEAEEAVQSGNLIWVEGYVRSDGTEVKGYFRKK